MIKYFLILLCGDIEENPGPKGYKICPQCKNSMVISVKQCSCGYWFNKKGRPSKTTGCPVGTSCVAGFNVSSGQPVGTTLEAGFNASNGRVKLALHVMLDLMYPLGVQLVRPLMLDLMFLLVVQLVRLLMRGLMHPLVVQ